MVKTKKIDHLHLVYQFTVPLKKDILQLKQFQELEALINL